MWSGCLKVLAFFAVAISLAASSRSCAAADPQCDAVPPVAPRKFPVKHLIVLMMENRSFDHMLGWLKRLIPEIDGLNGTEFNHVNPEDPSSEKVFVSTNGWDTGPDDPVHSFEGTTRQIYGYSKPIDKVDVPRMNGFVLSQQDVGQTLDNPMRMFNEESAPVFYTLAKEFAVMNRWFCSLPGPTDPNRAFAMSGTADGNTDNYNGTLWGQQSYFDFLTENGKSWKGYYQDDPWALFYFKDVWKKVENFQRMAPLETFFEDLEKGELPEFVWLQPRMTSDKGFPTWQHPDSSVKAGEKLIKDIYEALRKSKYWNDLAFVLTYDEHGGFFDHVPPPQVGIPAPDEVVGPSGFKYDRLGVRIPTLIISPWVAKGRIVNRPQGPTPTSEFEGTSVIATANKMFGIDKFLGKRMEWAGTFEFVLQELSEPRTDCVETLPEISEGSPEDLDRIRRLPLNDHMQIQVNFYCSHNNRSGDCGKHIKNQHEASVFLMQEIQHFVSTNKRLLGLMDVE